MKPALFMPIAAFGGTGSGEFDPSNLSPALWLDASDAASITFRDVTTFVSGWANKGSPAGNAVQATHGMQPTYEPTGLNGLPTITSPNGGKLMISSWAGVAAGPKLAVFAVVKLSATGNTRRLFGMKAATGLDYDNVAAGVLAMEITGDVVAGYRGGAQLSQISATIGASFVLTSIFDGATHTIYKNGVGATPVASTAAFGFDSFYVLNGPSEEGWTGSLSEAVVVVGGVTTEQQQDCEAYLAEKWLATTAAARQAQLPGVMVNHDGEKDAQLADGSFVNGTN